MATNGTAAIEVHGLRVDYDEVTAVCDLDLAIPPGSIYGLVGPNGAGKTTLIRTLAGLIDQSDGDIAIDGTDMAVAPEAVLKRVGYMPDFPPVYEELSCRHYLEVFAIAHRIPASERGERIRECASRTGIAFKLDSGVRELSRGMRQRLILAKTIMHRPRVLLLDEPASGMDPAGRSDMRELLKREASGGVTVLISSHILPELASFCDSIGIMEKGRLVVSGGLDDIRARIGSRVVLSVRLARESGTERREKLIAALRAHEKVTDVEAVDDECVRASYAGDDADAAALLASLVRGAFAVADFRVDREGLEDIFTRVGAEEVS
jgi:ABC-2 type transport system ATP-binding protein